MRDFFVFGGDCQDGGKKLGVIELGPSSHVRTTQATGMDVLSTTGRVYALAADTVEARSQWMDCMQRAITALQGLPSSVRPVAGEIVMIVSMMYASCQ